MKLFENKVGRPSNETLKKRRVFKIGIIIGFVIIFSSCFLLGYFNIINLRGYAAKDEVNLCKDTKIYISDKSRVYYKGSGKYYIWNPTVSNGRIRITKRKAYAGKKLLVAGWVNTSNLTCSNYEKGDVNMDGNITATDANLILQHVAGTKKLTSQQLTLADVNDDGKVTASDSKRILEMVAGITVIPETKVEESSISIVRSSDTLKVGDEKTVLVTMKKLTDTFEVESSNSSVLRVTNKLYRSFKLKAEGEGKATITIKSKKSGQTESYEYNVVKNSSDPVTTSASNSTATTISMTKFTDEWQFGATPTASVTLKTSGDTFEVSSSNPNAIIITNKTNTSYKLSAIGEGSSTITAKSIKTGQTVSYTYKVKPYKLPDNSRFGSNKNIKTKVVEDTTIYYENSCSTTVLNSYIDDIKYIKAMDDVKNNKDYPFKAVKAIYIVTKASFDKANPGYSNSPAVTHAGAISYIDIKCDKYTKTSVAHELGHAIDYRYGAINGTMLSNSFKNLYNKYVGLKSNRPLRDYSYEKTVDNAPYVEFFADSYTSYMGKATWSNFPGELKTEVKNAINKVINLQNW